MSIKEKLIGLIKQAFKFGIVGVLSTVIDFGLLYIFNSVLGVHYLVAAALSFFISLIFNYICSMKYVFVGRKDVSKVYEFIAFLIPSVMGLGLNELILWFLCEKFQMNVMLAKVFATAVVMVWNFVTRKIFIEEKNTDKEEMGEQ